MLLILDEAQTGLCRTGDWYAFERDGVVPDILTLSKTLGAGLPLAAVRDQRRDRGARPTSAGSCSSPPTSPIRSPAAVGNTVLDVLERDRLDLRAARARRAAAQRPARAAGPARGGRRRPRARPAAGRGAGRSTGRRKEPPTELGAAVTRRCLELGLHMNIVQLPGMGGTFRIAPPLTATDAEIDRGLAILDTALADVTA